MSSFREDAFLKASTVDIVADDRIGLTLAVSLSGDGQTGDVRSAAAIPILLLVNSHLQTGVMELSSVMAWDGGVRGCIAALEARSLGAKLDALLFTPPGEGQHDGLVALPLWILLAQAAAMSCMLVSHAGAFSEDQEIIEELHGLHAQGVRQAVFVSSNSAVRDMRYSRISHTTGLTPRWVSGRWPRQGVLDRLAAGRIEAVCVGVNTRFLPAWFCGRRFDEEFLDDLPPGVDALGSNGEFRTCVMNSLLYREPVSLTVDGRYRYQSSADAGGDQCWTALLRRPLWTA